MRGALAGTSTKQAELEAKLTCVGNEKETIVVSALTRIATQKITLRIDSFNPEGVKCLILSMSH